MMEKRCLAFHQLALKMYMISQADSAKALATAGKEKNVIKGILTILFSLIFLTTYGVNPPSSGAVAVAQKPPAFDATLAEWMNLLPAAPSVGQNAVLTVKIGSTFRSLPLSAFFRSGEKSFSVTLNDDGAHGDEKPNDGIFSCSFPAQDMPGLWTCVIIAGSGVSQTFSIPQIFAVSAKGTEYRALWADSWNEGFLTREQAQQFVRTAREANFNALIIEIRKVGDAAYDSRIEPRATNLKDPAFDPLKYVISLAHDTTGGKKRLEVHAWVVVYRIYKGSPKLVFPKAPHILGKHPEWASKNLKGEFFDRDSVYLDPGVPAVSDYTISVCTDIVTRYDVDGVNFDYIRYTQGGWGYNPIALERFRNLYNRKGTPEPTDPDWRAFQREQVTQFLRKAYVKLTSIKPSLKVSVCTIGWGDIPAGDFSRTEAYSAGIQDSNEWQRQQIMDINFRMGYKSQQDPKTKLQFLNWTRFVLGHQYFRLTPIGLGAYLNTLDDTLEQIGAARKDGANGVVLYCYRETNKNKTPSAQFYQAFQKRAFPEWADVPPLAWKLANPNGTFAGTVTISGRPADGALVSLPECKLQTRTDGTGFFAFTNVPAGHYQVTVNGKPFGACDIQPGRLTSVSVGL